MFSKKKEPKKTRIMKSGGIPPAKSVWTTKTGTQEDKYFQVTDYLLCMEITTGKSHQITLPKKIKIKVSHMSINCLSLICWLDRRIKAVEWKNEEETHTNQYCVLVLNNKLFQPTGCTSIVSCRHLYMNIDAKSYFVQGCNQQ